MSQKAGQTICAGTTENLHTERDLPPNQAFRQSRRNLRRHRTATWA